MQNLLLNKNCNLVSVFKDHMIYDFVDEFLKRFYNFRESAERLPKISKYYKNYLLFFCKPTFRNFKMNMMIQNYGDFKAEMYYKLNYGGSGGNNKKKKDPDYKSLFSKSTKENINHCSMTESEIVITQNDEINENYIPVYQTHDLKNLFNKNRIKLNDSNLSMNLNMTTKTIKSGLLTSYSRRESLEDILKTIINENYISGSTTNNTGTNTKTNTQNFTLTNNTNCNNFNYTATSTEPNENQYKCGIKEMKFTSTWNKLKLSPEVLKKNKNIMSREVKTSKETLEPKLPNNKISGVQIPNSSTNIMIKSPSHNKNINNIPITQAPLPEKEKNNKDEYSNINMNSTNFNKMKNQMKSQIRILHKQAKSTIPNSLLKKDSLRQSKEYLNSNISSTPILITPPNINLIDDNLMKITLSLNMKKISRNQKQSSNQSNLILSPLLTQSKNFITNTINNINTVISTQTQAQTQAITDGNFGSINTGNINININNNINIHHPPDINTKINKFLQMSNKIISGNNNEDNKVKMTSSKDKSKGKQLHK